MINVIVQGPRGGIVKQRLVEEITKAIASFGYQLGISRRKLIVAVSVSDDDVTPAGNSGECLELDNNIYSIGVALYSDWLLTLAHEMVHVKQFVKKELNPQLTVWKGKRILTEDYYKMPHEREAFKLQRKLVTGYTGE